MRQATTNACILRTAAPGDARQLAALSAELGYPSTPSEMADRLAALRGDPSHFIAVAESAERAVVGWIHASLLMHLESGKFVEIVGLVVGAEFRGRGAGKLLVAEAERWAAAHGCTRVTVRSNVLRKEARKFYERLGYAVVKEQNVFEKKMMR